MDGPEEASAPDLASAPTRASAGRSLAPNSAQQAAEQATSSVEAAHRQRPGSLPTYHVRAPSAVSTLESEPAWRPVDDSTDLSSRLSTVAGTDYGPRRPSTTASTAIHESRLRSVLSSISVGSLSPASALSSPALNALGDITPLPSPLVMSDSPGPWHRAARSRAASASSRDGSVSGFVHGSLSPSPSLKKKEGGKLKNAVSDAAVTVDTQAQQASDTFINRSKSISKDVPDGSHNSCARRATVSSAVNETDHRMHREVYLAIQRRLIPAKLPLGFPTPPASNASNRSVTDTEEDELAEDDKTGYIVVRHGARKAKKFWRPVRQLGQGTFSKVYLATCEQTAAKDPLDESKLDPRRLVAIKVCEHGPAGGADEQRVELSLKREVEMLQSISHPSLVHLKAFDHHDDQALIVLSYCPGGDLFDAASSHRDILTASVVQRIFAELVSAVRYLHANYIVHRDIKLENVLLNVPTTSLPLVTTPQKYPHALVTLTDLGLSRRIPAEPEPPLLTTRCGSEDYAAPEILLGQPYDGRATDAWALGVVLYALMEGRLPFDTPSKAASRSRAAHRIARCDWTWVTFANEDEEWDEVKGKDWTGAGKCVEGLLRKVSRGRKKLEEIEKMDWVQQGIQVEGGLKERSEEVFDATY